MWLLFDPNIITQLYSLNRILDVISIEKSGEHFRVLYDTQGKFVLKTLKPEEAKVLPLYKTLNVSYDFSLSSARSRGRKSVPTRFPTLWPMTRELSVTLTLKSQSSTPSSSIWPPTRSLSIWSSKLVPFCILILSWYTHHILGNLAYVTGGNNIGRVGTILHRERHLGSFDIVHIKDAHGKQFSTRISNIFVIGKGKKALISLPRDNGIYQTHMEKKEEKAKAAHH